MTTQACAQDWKEMYEKAARQAADWQQNFDVLQRALVGDTGASGIEVAHKLRKDAARYRWLRDCAPIRSEPVPFVCGLNDLALCGDECDAATDAAMMAFGAVGAA
jgi:hypothetical protein